MKDFDQKVASGRPSLDCLSAVNSQPNDSSTAPSPYRIGNDLRLPSVLRADCSRCTGLCCVVHSFYSVQGFAFDKPARSACRHLTLENRCEIHSELSSQGFPGCVAFDCYGAGQRVTQELFPGVNWRTSDETTAARIFSAYEACLALHRLMAMLTLAAAIASPMLSAQMRLKRGELDELCRTEKAKTRGLDIATLQNEVLMLVRNVPTQPDP